MEEVVNHIGNNATNTVVLFGHGYLMRQQFTCKCNIILLAEHGTKLNAKKIEPLLTALGNRDLSQIYWALENTLTPAIFPADSTLRDIAFDPSAASTYIIKLMDSQALHILSAATPSGSFENPNFILNTIGDYKVGPHIQSLGALDTYIHDRYGPNITIIASLCAA